MSNNLPQAITDPQAKVVEASADLGKEAVRALSGLGAYLKQIFGTVPEDLIGYFGGDYLRVARAMNIRRILVEAKKLNEARHINEEPISISLSLPLLVAAADESRDELVDIWARLLAAAADPSRSKSFRQSFIETVKRLDPIDALLLKAVWEETKAGESSNVSTDRIKFRIKSNQDEIEVSRDHLASLGLCGNGALGDSIVLKPRGREFMRALSD